MPDNATIFKKGRYFVVRIKGKIAKKQILGSNLGDRFFKSLSITNADNVSQIVIELKKPYIPQYTLQNGDITLKPQLPRKHNVENLKNGVPQNLLAVPYFISKTTFKTTKKMQTSYDESLFFSGVKAFYIKNYQLAAAFFNEIIRKYPQSQFFLSAYFLLGDCYKNMKMYDRAIAIYNRAISLSPKNDTVAQTLFSIADIYQKRKMFIAARTIYKKIEKDFASTKWASKAAFMIGYSYFMEHNCRLALKHLLLVDKSNPYYPLSMVLSAECFYQKKDYARAVLAYYYMSKKLQEIDVDNYYKELVDIGVSLCEFEDYKEAENVFGYVEQTHDKEIKAYSYIGRMRCDLKKNDFDDLKFRGGWILSNIKDVKLKNLARKLLDEGKLKKGDVDKKTIDEIVAKYKNDPEIVSLALYVYARKNYRNKDYIDALSYLIKLKKQYPESSYNKLAQPMAADAINKLLDEFYNQPDLELVEKIYDAALKLKPPKADLCRLAWALVFSFKIGEVEKIMHSIKDQECQNAVVAKFYVEMGNNIKASSIVDQLQKTKPYVYYINMIFGDINFFGGDYKKAYELYKKASEIKEKLMDDYLSLRMAECLINIKKLKDAEDILSSISVRIYSDKVEFFKGYVAYLKGDYKNSIAILKNLINVIQYRQRALFYIAMSYIKLNDKKHAVEYFNKLKAINPNSEYINILKALLL